MTILFDLPSRMNEDAVECAFANLRYKKIMTKNWIRYCYFIIAHAGVELVQKRTSGIPVDV